MPKKPIYLPLKGSADIFDSTAQGITVLAEGVEPGSMEAPEEYGYQGAVTFLSPDGARNYAQRLIKAADKMTKKGT